MLPVKAVARLMLSMNFQTLVVEGDPGPSPPVHDDVEGSWSGEGSGRARSWYLQPAGSDLWSHRRRSPDGKADDEKLYV